MSLFHTKTVLYGLYAIAVNAIAADLPPLEQATQIALTQNPEIRAARARWNAAKAKVPQAAAWEDPQIGADVERSGTTRFNSYSDVEYMASQKIPLSGKNRSQARIVEAEAADVFQQLRRVELDTVSKVRGAWYRLANARTQKSLIGTQEELLRQIAAAARIQFEANTRSQTDVLTAETELAKLQSRSVEFDQSASVAGADLFRMMAQNPHLNSDVATLPPWQPAIPSEAALLAVANLRRPEILAAQARVRSAEAAVQLSKRNWIPDPEVRIEARRFPERRGITEYDTGVFFSVPWVNSRKYRAAEEEAQSNLTAVLAGVEAARLEVSGMIRAQRARLSSLQTQVELSSAKFIPIAKQSLDASRVGFESGKTGIIDLLMAARSVREAEAEQGLKQAEYFAAVAELEAIVGGPLQPIRKSVRSSK